MAWKYIMLHDLERDRFVPVIFPDDLVHSFVAGAMQLVIEANDPKKDLRPRQLEQMLERGTAPVVGAGFVEGMAVCVAMGESESLGIKSRHEDTQLINNHPYEKGMIGLAGNTTELLILQRTIELLMTRMTEISG